MTSSTRKTFRVALTADFYSEDGSPRYRETVLELLDQHPATQYRCFEQHFPEIQPEQIGDSQGVIVDEDALYTALSQQQIGGAAIDCFVDEPIGGDHRFAQLDNILLAPHAIAWTDELFRDIGRAVCRGMIDLAQAKRPRGIVNPEVFDRPAFQQKWTRLQPPNSSHALPGSHLHESLPSRP